MKNITYTISVYAENNVGLLNRISAIFLKRHINLESFSTSASEIPDVFRFVIVVNTDADRVRKIVQQIEKQVDAINGEINAYNKIEPPVADAPNEAPPSEE